MKNLIKLQVKDYKSEKLYLTGKAWVPKGTSITYIPATSISKCDIKTLEHNASISWNPHDIFKDNINYIYWNGNLELPKFYLETSRLYSKTKLKKLSRMKAYKNKDFSFFSYSFMEFLLGNTQTKNFGMSGLFR